MSRSLVWAMPIILSRHRSQTIGHRNVSTSVAWYWHVDPLELHKRLNIPWMRTGTPADHVCSVVQP